MTKFNSVEGIGSGVHSSRWSLRLPQARYSSRDRCRHNVLLYVEGWIRTSMASNVNDLNLHQRGRTALHHRPLMAQVKPCMMDIITGKTKPDTGEVWLGSNINLLKMNEAEIANAGVGRKFQKPTVIECLTVWQNWVGDGGRSLCVGNFHRKADHLVSRKTNSPRY